MLFPNLTKEAVSVIDNLFALFRSINNWPGTKGIGNMDSDEIINLVKENPLIPDFKLRFIEAHKRVLEMYKNTSVLTGLVFLVAFMGLGFGFP